VIRNGLDAVGMSSTLWRFSIHLSNRKHRRERSEFPMDASDLPLPDLRAAIAVAALRHLGLAAKSIRRAQVTHAAHVQKVERGARHRAVRARRCQFRKVPARARRSRRTSPRQRFGMRVPTCEMRRNGFCPASRCAGRRAPIRGGQSIRWGAPQGRRPSCTRSFAPLPHRWPRLCPALRSRHLRPGLMRSPSSVPLNGKGAADDSWATLDDDTSRVAEGASSLRFDTGGPF
jgi:hypothetical protein